MNIKDMIDKPFMLIIRGLPGSGKSTFAELISHMTVEPIVIAEADQYFVEKFDGVFEPRRIADAHAWCRQKVQRAIDDRNNVIVSNTFTREWEYDEYLTMASRANYNIFVITMNNIHGNKSTHGVPEETVTKMRDRFEHSL
jgi:predicted ABC-type ATPase